MNKQLNASFKIIALVGLLLFVGGCTSALSQEEVS